MTIVQAATVMFSALALVLDGIAVLIFYQQYRADAFYDRLLALRERLFDLSLADGLIGWESQHALLYGCISKMIVHHRRFTLTRWVLMGAVDRRWPQAFTAPFPLQASGMGISENQALEEWCKRLRRVTLSHVGFGVLPLRAGDKSAFLRIATLVIAAAEAGKPPSGRSEPTDAQQFC